MKQNLGIIIIVLGALMLIFSYYPFDLVDYNFYNIGAFIIIVAGIVTHIVVTKRS
jgi:hypothetical protein